MIFPVTSVQVTLPAATAPPATVVGVTPAAVGVVEVVVVDRWIVVVVLVKVFDEHPESTTTSARGTRTGSDLDRRLCATKGVIASQCRPRSGQGLGTLVLAFSLSTRVVRSSWTRPPELQPGGPDTHEVNVAGGAADPWTRPPRSHMVLPGHT